MLRLEGSPNRSTDDPVALDWAHVQLPPAWPDTLNLRRPADVFALVRHTLGPRVRVELPEGLPGRERLPTYLLQEFHHLPNGTYSERMAGAYADWFDRSMLGVMQTTRRDVAQTLADCESVLDVGCGAGGLAGALHAQRARDVWGIDPCPYLLKCAAARHPGVRFVQGLAEATDFANERFDGIGACFLFHELPPDIADRSLQELHRILKPGGLLAIAEPAREQLTARRLRHLFWLGGWRALYFGLLARIVYEPAVAMWHARDLASWFPRFGFALERDESRIPIRRILVRKLV